MLFEALDLRPGGAHCSRPAHSATQKSLGHRRSASTTPYTYPLFVIWRHSLWRTRSASGISYGLPQKGQLPSSRIRVVVRAAGDRKGGWGLFPNFNDWTDSADDEQSCEVSPVGETAEDATQVPQDGEHADALASHTQNRSMDGLAAPASPAGAPSMSGPQSDPSIGSLPQASRPVNPPTGSAPAAPLSQESELEGTMQQGQAQGRISQASREGRVVDVHGVAWSEEERELAPAGEEVVEYMYGSGGSNTESEAATSESRDFCAWPAPPPPQLPAQQASAGEHPTSGWVLAFAVLLAVRFGRENAEVERFNPSSLQVKQQESRIQSQELRKKRKRYLEQERLAREAQAQKRVEEAALRREREEKQRKERERQQRIEAAEELERVRIQQEAARKAYLENEKKMEEEITRRAEIERQILLENEKRRAEEEERARQEQEAQARAHAETRRRAAEEAAARAAELKRQQMLEKQRLRGMTTWFGMHVKSSVSISPAPEGSLSKGAVPKLASIQVMLELSASHSPPIQPSVTWQAEEGDTSYSSSSNSSSSSMPHSAPCAAIEAAAVLSREASAEAVGEERSASGEKSAALQESSAATREGGAGPSGGAESMGAVEFSVQSSQCFASLEEAADDVPALAGAAARQLVDEYAAGPGQEVLAFIDETQLKSWMRAAALRVGGMVLDAVMVALQQMQRENGTLPSISAPSTSPTPEKARPAQAYEWDAEVLIEEGMLPYGHKKRVDTLLAHAAQVCEMGLLGEAETVLLGVLEETEYEWSRAGLASLPSAAMPILIPISVCAHLFDRSTANTGPKSRLYALVRHQIETRVRDAPRDTLLPISRLIASISGGSHPVAKIMADLADRNLSYTKREQLRLRRRQEQWELSNRVSQLSDPTAAESGAARAERRDSLTPIPEQVWALRNVAGNILAGGDPGQAVSMLTKAAQLNEEYFGASHPGRLAVLLDLCEAMSASNDPDPTPLNTCYQSLLEILHLVVQRYIAQGDKVSAATVADAAVRSYDGQLDSQLMPWLDQLRSAASEALQGLSSAESRTVLNRRRTPGMRVLKQLSSDFSEQLGAYSASSTTRISLLEAWNKNMPLPPTR